MLAPGAQPSSRSRLSERTRRAIRSSARATAFAMAMRASRGRASAARWAAACRRRSTHSIIASTVSVASFACSSATAESSSVLLPVIDPPAVRVGSAFGLRALRWPDRVSGVQSRGRHSDRDDVTTQPVDPSHYRDRIESRSRSSNVPLVAASREGRERCESERNAHRVACCRRAPHFARFLRSTVATLTSLPAAAQPLNHPQKSIDNRSLIDI